MTYLAHHGILGMKWGVRRYQNPDGTLTEAGRKRYSRGYGPDGSLTKEEARLRSSKSRKNVSKYEAILRAETDTRNLKGADKRKREIQILKDWNNPDASIRDLDRAVELYKRVNKESGDWYFKEGVSEGFKRHIKEMDALDNKYPGRDKWELNSEYRRERGLLYDKLFGTVLRDIGYEDTEEARRLIETMILVD